MITPDQILFYAGGRSLELYGTPYRRTRPKTRGGEEVAQTFTRASTGSYTDRDGEVKLAESGLQRIDMVDLDGDGIRETPAFLLEDARTNLLLRSEELDNASWTKVRSSIGTNTDVAPDNLTTGDRLIEDSTASSTHFVRQDITITADANIAFSKFVKGGTRSKVALLMTDTAGADTVTTWFNLTTGALGTTGTVAGTGAHVRSLIESLGNDWYHCTVVGSIGGGVTTARLITYVTTTDGQTSYSGDGASYIILWGGQGEDNVSFPSSYIATAGSTVARAVDAMSFPYTAKPQTSSVYVRFIERGTSLGADNDRIVQYGEGANPGTRLDVVSGKYRIAHNNGDGGSTVTSTAAAAPAIGDTVELVGQMASDGAVTLIQSINGATAVTAAASGAEPFGAAWDVTKFYINSSTTTTRVGFNAFVDVAVFAGVHSMADCRKALQQ